MTEGTLVGKTGKFKVADMANELAIKRELSRSISNNIEIIEVEIRETEAGKKYDKLHLSLAANQTEEMELVNNLRTLALEVAIELKIKDPAPGVTVTKKTTFNIVDEPAALEACRESYPQLIKEKIDKGALKKIVVALGEPVEGTELSTEKYGQVKIATDLSKYYLTDEPPF